MKNISLTQAGNYTALVTILVILLPKFGIQISESELTNLIVACITVVSILVSVYGRYRQGDVSILGVKTNAKDE